MPLAVSSENACIQAFTTFGSIYLILLCPFWAPILQPFSLFFVAPSLRRLQFQMCDFPAWHTHPYGFATKAWTKGFERNSAQDFRRELPFLIKTQSLPSCLSWDIAVNAHTVWGTCGYLETNERAKL